MKHGLLERSISILVVFLMYQASALGAEVVLSCQAEFSFPGGSVMTAVQITKNIDGSMQSKINGEETNNDVKLEEYRVREKLNMKTDPSSPEFSNLNAAEIALGHLQALMDNEESRPFIKIPFPLEQVKKMRIYDLQGRQDEFGGTVLMEAYNQEGKLLGRVFRSLLASGCY